MAFTILNDPAAPVNPAGFGDQAEPDSVDFQIIANAFDGHFVISGCAVTAQGTPDMTVAVAAGSAMYNGAPITVAGGNVTITTADATNPRIDLVVTNTGGTLLAIDGTANANPCMPAVPGSRVVLAAVYVPANDTAISSNQITDKRVIMENYARLAGTEGGQTLYGDSLSNGNLILGGTSHATHTTSIISMLDHIRLASGKAIQDSGGNTRITLGTSTPHVTLSGDVSIGSGFLQVNPTISVGTAYNLISSAPTANFTAGSIAMNCFDLTANPTTDAGINSCTVRGFNASIGLLPEDSTTGHILTGLVAGVVASGTNLSAAASATIANIYGVDISGTINIGTGKTITVTTMTGIRARITATGAGTQNIGDAIFVDLPNPSAFDSLTNLYGVRIGAFTRAGTLNVGVDIGQPSGATTNIGLRNAGPGVYTPSTTQTLAAAGNAILANARVVMIDNSTGASLTLTSTPTIADGADGQFVTIVNVDSADNVVIQDQGTLASSNLRLPGAANLTLGPRDMVTLMFSSTLGDWVCVNASNN